ncbi:MAG: hypothetical protein ACRC57_03825 [Sarcina sp.]
MKIAIISIVNIKHMSLIKVYTNILEKFDIEYDVIYIDKYREYEEIGATNIYKYELAVNREHKRIKKIFKYINFRKYAIPIMKANSYDFIIVWRTETALLFFDYLFIKAPKKYCINIRDYCGEKRYIIKKILGFLINKASFTTISSVKFKSFLPKNDYIHLHSFNESILKKSTVRTKLNKKNKLKIGFIGYVRFYEYNKKILNELKNDDRFILQYFGAGSEILEKYCNENEIINVEFLGNFNVEDTSKLLEKVDIINNLYGNNEIALDTAISIRYYYGIYLKLPILVCKDTYMQEITRGLSFIFDNDFENLGDRIYHWYHTLNFKEFSEICERKILAIKEENKKFCEIFEKVINKDEV